MNFKIRILSLLLFIFVSSSSFAQYKYDIGLKVSSYDMERFQLESRLHLKSPYSILVNYSRGSFSSTYFYPVDNVTDSTFTEGSGNISIQTNTLKFGVQRKLQSLACDVFYAGATLGLGYETRNRSTYTSEYSYETTPPSPSYYGEYDLIESYESSNTFNLLNTQLALSFGIDAPLKKRFVINVEVGLAGILSHNLSSKYNHADLIPSISGGLRYQFGKRE